MLEFAINISIVIIMITLSVSFIIYLVKNIVKNDNEIIKNVEMLRVELNNSINCSRKDNNERIKDISNLLKRVQDQNERLIILEHASQK